MDKSKKFIITNVKTTEEKYRHWKSILTIQKRNVGEELGQFIEQDIKKNEYVLRKKGESK